jgi:hypothetical protein
MSTKERAAYAAWKGACAAMAQEGGPREWSCGTLLGLAALVVLLIGLMDLGGAKADAFSDQYKALQQYEYDQAVASGGMDYERQECLTRPTPQERQACDREAIERFWTRVRAANLHYCEATGGPRGDSHDVCNPSRTPDKARPYGPGPGQIPVATGPGGGRMKPATAACANQPTSAAMAKCFADADARKGAAQ